MDNHTGQTTPRTLQRRSDGRFIGGVAGGLADFTGLDPLLFRVGFVVLTILGAAGILLYVLGWLLIPEAGQADPIARRIAGRFRGRWLALGLLAIPVVVLSDWVQIGDQDWDLAWAIALMAIGFVLLKDDERDERTKAPRPTTATALASPAVEAAVPRRRKPRSPLTFMTLGAAFVACAIASMFTASGAVSLDAGQFVALAVMVVGLGLVVGGWWGRARFLVVIAMFLLPVMVVASMVDAPLRGDVGGGYVSVGRENPDEYSLLVGTMTLDYSNYRFEEGETAKVDVTFFAGDFEIYVPPGVDVVVRGEMDIGTADLFGAGFDGRNMSFDNESFDRKGLTKGSLIVNVDGGLGSFDLTWARWVEQQKRFDLRQEERKEHKARRDERGQESDARKGAKKDGRRKDSN